MAYETNSRDPLKLRGTQISKVRWYYEEYDRLKMEEEEAGFERFELLDYWWGYWNGYLDATHFIDTHRPTFELGVKDGKGDRQLFLDSLLDSS